MSDLRSTSYWRQYNRAGRAKRHATVLLLAACQFLLCGGIHGAAASPHGRVVGYATDWDPTQDRDAGKIDTLIFAFAKLIDGRVVLDKAG